MNPNEFLFECYCGEIPATMQYGCIDFIKKELEKHINSYRESIFEEASIEDNLYTFISPNRIVIYLKNLKPTLSDYSELIRGPKTSANPKAIEGFCRKNNVNISELVIDKCNKDEHYFYKMLHKGIKTSEYVASLIEEVIKSVKWNKTVQINDSSYPWIRPISSVLCIFNSEIVDLTIGDIRSSNKTRGHFLMSPEEFEVKSPKLYFKKLEEKNVIVDHNLRREIITKYINKYLSNHNLIALYDENLLEELTGLVEYPVPLLGEIDAEFLDIPQHFISKVLRKEQRYITFLQGDKLYNKFLFIANIGDKSFKDKEYLGEGSAIYQKVIQGNERVLAARLEDLRFFYNKSIDSNLEEWFKQLNRISGLNKKFETFYPAISCVEGDKSWPELSEEELQGGSALYYAVRYYYVDLVTPLLNEAPEFRLYLLRECLEREGYKESADIIDECIDIINSQGIWSDDNLKDIFEDKPNAFTEAQIHAVIIVMVDFLLVLAEQGVKKNLPTANKDPLGLKNMFNVLMKLLFVNVSMSPFFDLYSFAVFFPKMLDDKCYLDDAVKNNDKKIMGNMLEDACFYTDQNKDDYLPNSGLFSNLIFIFHMFIWHRTDEDRLLSGAFNKRFSLYMDYMKWLLSRVDNYLNDKAKIILGGVNLEDSIYNYFLPVKISNMTHRYYLSNWIFSFLTSSRIMWHLLIHNLIFEGHDDLLKEYFLEDKSLNVLYNNSSFQEERELIRSSFHRIKNLIKGTEDTYNITSIRPIAIYMQNSGKNLDFLLIDNSDYVQSKDIINSNIYHINLSEWIDKIIESKIDISDILSNIPNKEKLYIIDEDKACFGDAEIAESVYFIKSKKPLDDSLELQNHIINCAILFGLYQNLLSQVHGVSISVITKMRLLPFMVNRADFKECLPSIWEGEFSDLDALGKQYLESTKHILEVMHNDNFCFLKAINNFLDNVKIHDDSSGERIKVLQICCYHLKKVLNFHKIV